MGGSCISTCRCRHCRHRCRCCHCCPEPTLVPACGLRTDLQTTTSALKQRGKPCAPARRRPRASRPGWATALRSVGPPGGSWRPGCCLQGRRHAGGQSCGTQEIRVESRHVRQNAQHVSHTFLPRRRAQRANAALGSDRAARPTGAAAAAAAAQALPLVNAGAAVGVHRFSGVHLGWLPACPQLVSRAWRRAVCSRRC